MGGILKSEDSLTTAFLSPEKNPYLVLPDKFGGSLVKGIKHTGVIH